MSRALQQPLGVILAGGLATRMGGGDGANAGIVGREQRLAGLGAVEPAPTKPGEVAEGAGAHLGFDVDAQHVAPVGHHQHQPGIDDVDADQRHRGQHDQSPVAARQQVVDEARDGQRKGQLEQAREHGGSEIKPEEPHVRTVIVEELSKHGGP